jgi:translation elongation factor EF-1beta
MFGEYLLFLFLAAVASNLLMFESHSMPNEDDLADDVDVGPSAATVTVSSNKVIPFNGNGDSILDTKIFEKENNTKETKSDPKIIELAFEPIAFAFQNIQYKVKVNDGSLCIPSHQTIFKLIMSAFQ